MRFDLHDHVAESGVIIVARARICAVVAYLLATLLLISQSAAQDPPASQASSTQPAQPAPARIGVLAYRGSDDARQTWQPTADYLQSQVADAHFEIVPLDFGKINDAVAQGQIEFVLTSPANYVDLEYHYGVTRIATLVAVHNGIECQQFGAVIFCGADRRDISSLRDLKGKSFLATDANSFGGWWMGWRELGDQGIVPQRDFKPLKFGGTQDAVVLGVRNKLVDAGTVRTDQLEQMAAEGRISLADFKILNPQAQTDEFPFRRSTRLYPEWPIARLNHTPEKIARDVTMALLRMPRDSLAAKTARSAGWTIPLDYTPVHELMKDLRLGPYANYGVISFRAAASQYRVWVAIGVAVLVVLAGTIFYLLMLNRRLTRPQPSASGTRLAGRLRVLSVVNAITVISVGIVVLTGWTFQLDLLTRLLPGVKAMNPASAVALTLGGVALLLQRPTARLPFRTIGRLCAAVVVFIALAKLVSYVTDFDIGLDRLLFAQSLDRPGPGGANRMAPNTAIALLLAGAALLCLEIETRRGRRPTQWLALFAGALALLALIGYAYGVKGLFGVGSFVPMSLPSAIAFLLLALGMLWTHPDRGLMASVTSDSSGGVLARRLIPACVLVPAVFGWLRLLGQRAGFYGDEVGLSLNTVANIIFFVILVWWTVGLLHRADAERRKTETALAESEERNRVIVQRAGDGITLVDASTLKVIDINEAFSKLIGYSREEVVGRAIFDFIVDTKEGVAARAQETLGNVSTTTFGRRQYRRKDGSVVDVEKSATVVQLAGKPVMCTVVHDITERKRAEDALARERSLLRTLIDNLPDRIYVKDIDGRYMLDNAAHLQQLGFSDPREVIGKTVGDLFPPEVAERYERDDRQVMGAAQPIYDREEQFIDRQGNRRWLLTTKVPLNDGHGKTIGLVGMSRDITDRKTAELALEEKHHQLEEAMTAEKAAHKELKLAQSAMVQSEKLAGLGQMVAGVAHEINNPLAFVSNNVAVLQRDAKALGQLLGLYQKADAMIAERDAALVAEIKDLAERMDLGYTMSNMNEMLVRSRDGLKRIQQIVKDLREFARLDAGDLHEVDLNSGIESTINIVRGSAKKRQVVLETQLQPLPPVTCYPAKINQVVMNLVTNAIDASDENGKVVVSTAREDGAIRIQVADSGHGIPPEIRQRIFDPFFTTKKIGEGTGLGLSISYGIVRDHGGQISVDSEVGKGTTFTVRLPVHGGLRKPS